MKFAQYLQDTQTPEWKKAYLDYRGLKKRIGDIRRNELGTMQGDSSDNDADENEDLEGGTRLSTIAHPESHIFPQPPPQIYKPSNSMNAPSSIETNNGAPSDDARSHRSLQKTRDTNSHDQSSDSNDTDGDKNSMSPLRKHAQRATGNNTTSNKTSPDTSPVILTQDASPNKASILPRSLMRRPTLFTKASSIQEPQIPLDKLIPSLPHLHQLYFNKLEAELAKVDKFHRERENDAVERSRLLNIQLKELQLHRRLYYELNPENKDKWLETVRKALIPSAFNTLRTAAVSSALQAPVTSSVTATLGSKMKSGTHRDNTLHAVETGNRNEHERVFERSLDADEYPQAKKELKRAVLEHYRFLEMLNNFRVVNSTGFRKALKKYEKVTQVHVQKAYMAERVETTSLGDKSTVTSLMTEMEQNYAARFEKGDKKRATRRLRSGAVAINHHFSTFCTGFSLGIALAAFISGFVQSFQPNIREHVKGWDALLFIYIVLATFVAFSLLIGLNLMVWTKSRINYPFIFEFDMRSRLDYREYFETPSILMLLLCLAFWLNFSPVDNPDFRRFLPLIWLLFALAFMFNPLPIGHYRSRLWLLRSCGRLLVSGTSRVEFTDFWLGDQFCSLSFPLSNLYFIGCSYRVDFDSQWTTCGTANLWPAPFVLAQLPLFIRLVQSFRRYYDSGLEMHLINAGKYASGIIYYLFFYRWRHLGAAPTGSSFVLFCIFASFYSIYAGTWDYLMDWSFFQRRSKHFLLRSELLYPGFIPFYYFAIVSNLVLRFLWVFYIPQSGPSLIVRSVILGLLEILRRWQWNFFRLENEQIGNMDQYRITREVPLPYNLDQLHFDDDEDGDTKSLSSSFRRHARNEAHL